MELFGVSFTADEILGYSLSNFPSNVYYNLISYELAVIFCIKQGKDAQALIALLQDEWNLFYDSETRDGYQQYRVRNVYNNRLKWSL